jgi:pSer/pThr/pTyr-binding forkhead associated (FHA) protein
MQSCTRCGRAGDGQYRFCLGCGAALPTPASAAPARADLHADDLPPPPLAEGTPVPTAQASHTGEIPLPPGAAAKIGKKRLKDQDSRPAIRVAVSLPARAESEPPAPQPKSAPSEPPKFTPRSNQDIDDDMPTVAMDAIVLPDAASANQPTSGEDQQRAASIAGDKKPSPSTNDDPQSSVKCDHCGAMVAIGHRFCGVCGTSMPPDPVSKTDSSVGHLALIDDLGAESTHYPLVSGENAIGRATENQIAFPHDGLLAHTHCVLLTDSKPFRIKPIDAFNGTFLRISTPVELEHGDTIRIGQEVLRFERIDQITPEMSTQTGRSLTVGCPMPRGVWGRLCQIGMTRTVANAYLLAHRDVFLGRERGDILFPKDGFVSGSHAVISERGGRVFLKDLGSSNGTFLRLKAEIKLRDGDLLLLGRNLLRIHAGAS